MRRRTVIAAAGVGIAAGGAGVVLGTGLGSSQDRSGPVYRRHDSVTYEHDSLELRSSQVTVGLGETVEFEVTNTGDSPVGLGCHNPWALQREGGDGWEHVAWTGGKYVQLCLTELPPRETLVENLSLTTEGLDASASSVASDLRTGTYRFVLLGPSPFLATEFTVRESPR